MGLEEGYQPRLAFVIVQNLHLSFMIHPLCPFRSRSDFWFLLLSLLVCVLSRQACMGLEEGYQPRLTFVIVQKRHHTRFFVPDRRFQDRSGNALPGTVVDKGICHPTQFDFYLMAHAGIQVGFPLEKLHSRYLGVVRVGRGQGHLPPHPV